MNKHTYRIEYQTSNTSSPERWVQLGDWFGMQKLSFAMGAFRMLRDIMAPERTRVRLIRDDNKVIEEGIR